MAAKDRPSSWWRIPRGVGMGNLDPTKPTTFSFVISPRHAGRHYDFGLIKKRQAKAPFSTAKSNDIATMAHSGHRYRHVVVSRLTDTCKVIRNTTTQRMNRFKALGPIISRRHCGSSIYQLAGEFERSRTRAATDDTSGVPMELNKGIKRSRTGSKAVSPSGDNKSSVRTRNRVRNQW